LPEEDVSDMAVFAKMVVQKINKMEKFLIR